jgi:hypothetical protein
MYVVLMKEYWIETDEDDDDYLVFIEDGDQTNYIPLCSWYSREFGANENELISVAKDNDGSDDPMTVNWKEYMKEDKRKERKFKQITEAEAFALLL